MIVTSFKITGSDLGLSLNDVAEVTFAGYDCALNATATAAMLPNSIVCDVAGPLVAGSSGPVAVETLSGHVSIATVTVDVYRAPGAPFFV